MENEKIDVRTQQLQMAQNMGISKEGMDFLVAIEMHEWKKRELYYLCLLDGISVEQLRRNEEKSVSIDWIKKMRMDYWRGKVVEREALSPIGKEVEKLKSEVKTVCQESKELRQTLEDNLEKSLRQQSETQKEAINAKSKVIEMLEESNKRFALKVTERETKIESLIQQLKELEKQIESKDDSWNAEVKKTASKVKKIRMLQIRGGLLQGILKSISTKKFIRDYLKSENLSPEQKEFLLDCLEEGVDVRDLEHIAVPGLDIKMMERLKRLQVQQKGER